MRFALGISQATFEGVANVTGKGGKTRVVGLSRGTWAELQALRTDETFGESPQPSRN